MYDRRIAAYHEAGHSVRCYFLGKKFKRILLPRDEKERPHVDIDMGSLSNEERVAILMAGFAAQSIFEPNWQGINLGDDDFREALAVIKPSVDIDDPNSGPLAIDIIRRKFNEAQADLRKHWPAVMALAAELMRSDEVDYEVAVKIIRNAPS